MSKRFRHCPSSCRKYSSSEWQSWVVVRQRIKRCDNDQRKAHKSRCYSSSSRQRRRTWRCVTSSYHRRRRRRRRWRPSWVLASMSRRASSSCIGCRSAGWSRLSCAVSCTQFSTGSIRTISLTSWVSSTAVAHVAVFDLHRRRISLWPGCAPSSTPARLRGTHCRRTYPTCCQWFWTFHKTTQVKTHFSVWFQCLLTIRMTLMHLWPIIVICAL